MCLSDNSSGKWRLVCHHTGDLEGPDIGPLVSKTGPLHFKTLSADPAPQGTKLRETSECIIQVQVNGGNPGGED